MTLRPLRMRVPVLLVGLAVAASGRAPAQVGIPGSATVGAYGSGFGSGIGYGANPLGGTGYRYGIANGQIGAGSRSAGRLYQGAIHAARPQTTVAYQPLFDAITLVPGWSGQVRRARQRAHSQPATPPIQTFDHDGRILWPSTVPADPSVAELRRSAESAVKAVVTESNTTGHASVRPVVDAKNKLEAFEKKILPQVRAKNATDGSALEAFFLDLDKALDTLTYTF